MRRFYRVCGRKAIATGLLMALWALSAAANTTRLTTTKSLKALSATSHAATTSPQPISTPQLNSYGLDLEPKLILRETITEIELLVSGCQQPGVTIKVNLKEVKIEEMEQTDSNRRFKALIDPTALELECGWQKVSVFCSGAALSRTNLLGVIERPTVNEQPFSTQIFEEVAGSNLTIGLTELPGKPPSVMYGWNPVSIGKGGKANITVAKGDPQSVVVNYSEDLRFTQPVMVHPQEITAKGAELTFEKGNEDALVVTVEGLNGTPNRLALLLENEGRIKNVGLQLRSRTPQKFVGTLEEQLEADQIHLEWQGRRIWSSEGCWHKESAGVVTWQPRKPKTEVNETLDWAIEDSARVSVELRGIELDLKPIAEEQFYQIGLTEKQRQNPTMGGTGIGPLSAVQGGPLEIRLLSPFLMQVYEVTNRQYLTFLRDPEAQTSGLASHPVLSDHLRQGQKLDPAIADLPVVHVSMHDAKRFAHWLQQELTEVAPGWTVRLPHEIEWEMAARGNDPRRFAFPDSQQQERLQLLQNPELRNVGENRIDVSPFGIRDMTGNAREWTESVFDEMLLTTLRFHIGAQTFDGWDPAAPYMVQGQQIVDLVPAVVDASTTARISIRGGRNGERPHEMFWVSARRSAEISMRSPDVGFRLIFVPEGSR